MIDKVTFGANPVKIGKLVKHKKDQLILNKALADVLGQTDKDYFNLTRQAKVNKTTVPQPANAFVEGVKNLLEKGSMF